MAAIPARYASTRLPGKPLLDLGGRPMVEHVYRRAAAARGIGRVVVLTDDERIATAVRAFGGEVEITPGDCASGTDRIAWAARGWDAGIVVNVQGDEPLVDPLGIERLVAHLESCPGDEMATLAAEAAVEDLGEPSVVKVVVDQQGYALYFSRAPIPFPRHAEGAAALRHLGLYGYRHEALLRLASLPPSPLERRESLEQLRALEHGIRIRVLAGAVPSPAVDTPEDAARVASLIAELARERGS